MTRIFRFLRFPLLLALLLGALGPAALALDKPGRLKIMSAVVQVWWIVDTPTGLRGAGMGSGTLISPDGLILTNHHVAVPDEEGVDYLGVALTTRSDQLPQVAYIAKVVAADAYLDLAVLRVSHDLDLRPIRPADLNLPYIPLGDSDSVDVGDELNIFGYPDIGGNTVTFTKGVVSGFTLDVSITGRAWIKTDTTIAGGNSGGTAVDENGFLVGVPTEMGAGDADSYVDCRNLVDTNHDGRRDQNDVCVPGGGFINALRPVKLALPLIEAARQGLAYQGRGSQPANAPGPAPAGRPRLSNLQFSTGVTEADQPSNLVSSLPSGSRSLYLFFDYENMVDGAPWGVRVLLDGQDMDTGLASQPWAGGPAGNWWVGWSDADFADGLYTFRILVSGQQLAEATIRVGGRAQAAPAFSNIAFSQEVTGQGEAIDPGRLFPEGIRRLYVLFDYENMTPGLRWTRTWLFDNEVVATTTEAWDEGASGSYLLELTADNGLDAGNWRLELAIQGSLAARADFTVAGQQGGALFGPFTFARDIDQRTGQPIGPVASLPSGVTAFYIFSEYSGMKDGLNCISRVYLNGAMVIDNAFTWGDEWLPWQGEAGVWSNVITASGNALPDGEYTQELIVEGQVVQSGSIIVGGGAPAAPALQPAAPVDGVQVQGVISDLDTGRPIAGAFFIVLKPGISVQAFQWTDVEVYTLAESDRQGFYRLPLPLERDRCYSLIIGAEGYWPHTEDDVCVDQSAPALAEVPIQLQRR